MSAIAVENISKHWTTAEGQVRAVDGLSFALDEGTLNVLLGPSGCGKSTTLRLIAGLEPADQGRILIGGRDVTRLPPAQRNIAMVFQSYALFPHLSVAENIVFGLRVRKVGDSERDSRLARVAGLLGLSKLLDRKPSQLSGGQQQRVALGRAIVNQAPVCLMDEPLSNLDAQLRAEMRQEMRREIRALQRKLGITMVYVTHDQTEAMTMADQVILLRDGHVEQDGTPENLYNRPASAFTARFIGTPPMNVVTLPGHSARGLLLGVRPEDIRIGTDGVAAVVENVEYLGADSIVACRAGTESLTVRLPRAAHLAPGTGVKLSWSSAAAHYFDATTGLRAEAPAARIVA